jgi:hypothetical protein
VVHEAEELRLECLTRSADPAEEAFSLGIDRNKSVKEIPVKLGDLVGY